MINIEFAKYYTKINVLTTPNKAEVQLRVKFSLKFIGNLVLSQAFVYGLMLGIPYYLNHDVGGIWVSFLILFSGITLYPLFFSKKGVTIYPLSRQATNNDSYWQSAKINWPNDYSLAYEKKYNSENKFMSVELIAVSQNKSKSIPIYSFPDLNTFMEFLKIYNLNFPLNSIKE